MSARTINKNEPADFTPTLGNYTDLQPFRFWCQKVLPLVYDDSLSYYELLCKVVDYLNKTMEDVDVLEGDVTELHEAYKKLQNYVNTYFNSLDVQEEINNKLDSFVKDGTLNSLFLPYIQISPIFVDSISNMTDRTKIYVLKTDGHLYSYRNNNWVDSGIAYGINGIYPKNVDYNTWNNTIGEKQVFMGSYSQYVDNKYSIKYENGLYEGVPKLVENGSSIITGSSFIIGFTMLNNLYSDDFMERYTAFVYLPVDGIELGVYGMDEKATFNFSFHSKKETRFKGINKINFTEKTGDFNNIKYLGLSISYNSALTEEIVDQIRVCLVKDYYDGTVFFNKESDKQVAFIGDSLTALNYMQFFNNNKFKVNIFAVGGEGINEIFGRTNIDALYIKNKQLINNNDYIELSTSGMFKQGNGNVNPVSVNEHVFNIVLENGNYKVTGLTESFEYYGEAIKCNIANKNIDFCVIWCGTNNIGRMSVTDIVESWKKALKVYPNSIILGITYDRFGDSATETIKEIDTLASNTFGNRYLPLHDNIVKYGLSYNNLTPTLTDSEDIKNGKIPSQLLDGKVHYTEYGKKYVAHLVQEKLKMFNIV